MASNAEIHTTPLKQVGIEPDCDSLKLRPEREKGLVLLHGCLVKIEKLADVSICKQKVMATENLS